MVEQIQAIEIPIFFKFRARIRELFVIPPIDPEVAARYFAAKRALFEMRVELIKAQSIVDQRCARKGCEPYFVFESSPKNLEILEEYEIAFAGYNAAKKLFGPKFPRKMRTKL